MSDQVISWRRALHAIPELGLHLPQTADYVVKELARMGLAVRRLETCSGLVCDIEGLEGPGQTVALRADMDALPVRELTGLPYASANGNMHACGHDAHTAMLLGVASTLLAEKRAFPGRVRLLFQPAEESVGGAEPMIREGVLDGVDVIFAQHVGALSGELSHGNIGLRAGVHMASRDAFTITVRGKGGHGASPEEAVNPVIVSAYLLTTLQTLISQEISGADSAVFSVCTIHGGDAGNIIPDNVVMEGSIRSCGNDLRAKLIKRLPEMCQGICRGFRADCSVDFGGSYLATVNDAHVTDFVAKTAAELLGAEQVKRLSKPTMGSEDVSFFLDKVPGCYWEFCTSPVDREPYPHHSPYFTIDDSLLPAGSDLMAKLAVKWLKEHKPL